MIPGGRIRIPRPAIIRLDYAYAKHKIGGFFIYSRSAGKSVPDTWLFWDGDLRPTGITAQYATRWRVHLFGRLRHTVYKTPGEDTAMLFAGQVVTKQNREVSLLAAVGYQHFDGVFSNQKRQIRTMIFTSVIFTPRRKHPLGRGRIIPYGQIWCNFGAEGEDGEGQLGGNLNPGDEDLGFILDWTRHINKFVKVGYAYAVVGADSIYGALTDSDFGNG